LCARGHTEILTTSFTSGREVGLIGWKEDDPRTHLIPIKNPLSSNHSYMRTSLLPGALSVMQQNISHDNRRLHLFEVGNVFIPRPGSDGLPDEPRHLLIVRSEPGGNDFWRDSSEPADLFGIKQELELLLAAMKIDRSRLRYHFNSATGEFEYFIGKVRVIEGGIVGPRLAAAYEIEQPIWFADINLTGIAVIRERSQSYRALSEYPASKRDLSLLGEATVDYAQIEKSLVKHGGRLLESVQVFDVYQGEHLPENRTAYGVRLYFRSNEGTLVDADVDVVVTKMITKLESELGVHLRS